MNQLEFQTTQETVEAKFADEPKNMMVQSSDPVVLKNKIAELYQEIDALKGKINIEFSFRDNTDFKKKYEKLKLQFDKSKIQNDLEKQNYEKLIEDMEMARDEKSKEIIESTVKLITDQWKHEQNEKFLEQVKKQNQHDETMTSEELRQFYYQLDLKYQEEMTAKEQYIQSLKNKLQRHKTKLAKDDIFINIKKEKAELLRQVQIQKKEIIFQKRTINLQGKGLMKYVQDDPSRDLFNELKFYKNYNKQLAEDLKKVKANEQKLIEMVREYRGTSSLEKVNFETSFGLSGAETDRLMQPMPDLNDLDEVYEISHEILSNPKSERGRHKRRRSKKRDYYSLNKKQSPKDQEQKQESKSQLPNNIIKQAFQTINLKPKQSRPLSLGKSAITLHLEEGFDNTKPVVQQDMKYSTLNKFKQSKIIIKKTADFSDKLEISPNSVSTRCKFVGRRTQEGFRNAQRSTLPSRLTKNNNLMGSKRSVQNISQIENQQHLPPFLRKHSGKSSSQVVLPKLNLKQMNESPKGAYQM